MKYLSLLLLLCFNASAEVEAIYGEDSRMDVYAVTNPLFVNLAKTTAAMIERSKIKTDGSVSLISGKPLAEMFKLCPAERFRNQPSAANCSGTLVAPDVIMTAGHCYDLAKQMCKDYVWVFDYKVSKENQSSVTVPSSNVYECDSVLLKEMKLETGMDHALIKLKRPVTDRVHATLRSSGTVKVNDPLVLIGHPSGLPTKIAADAFVVKVLKNSFTSNVDAFSINSGSGVFNALTGEVEGILSSGQQDYDGAGNCTSLKYYEMEEGKETVVNVEAVRKFLEKGAE
ncbi:MAG: trypsin-like peptidase domain-containing protein [Bdellovibrionales bacterium]|nr:trypsin-like peptidase domain-containing protein [Bdellovibrionales bacterium]